MADQEEMWDGTGVDPWLPERLAAEARIVEAEQRLYSSWWGTFSSWIVQVRRGVLSGYTPDPHAVWAFAPAWVDRMAEFVAGPVKQTMGIGYRRIFGDGYKFDARPAVARHLAEVTNRMSRTPDAVFNSIAAEVANGAGSGESIPSIARRVETILSTTGTDAWRSRGVVVARTEALGSLNAGRQDSFVAVAEELGGEFESQWLSTIDARVRPAHAAADLQRVPLGTPFIVGGERLMRPGDPSGSAGNTVQCRCSSLLVRPDESVDLTNRGFKDSDDYWASQVKAKAPKPAVKAKASPPSEAERFDSRIRDAKVDNDALAAAPAARDVTGGLKLTEDEQDALGDYESVGIAMNEALRKGGDIDPWLLGKVDAFDAILDRSPLTSDVQTWRGLSNSHALFGNRLDENLTGFEWREDGYISTTTMRSTAEKYTKRAGRRTNPTVMRVLAPKGTGAARISGLSEQAELALDRGLRLRVVTDRGLIDGVRHLDVEVVPE